ncbi:hypothetical protein TOK_4924 [Pseudonocardia sp. N23]|nr:hypothetical protein TOK_4924 [Pseudonocardia sp. N23]
MWMRRNDMTNCGRLVAHAPIPLPVSGMRAEIDAARRGGVVRRDVPGSARDEFREATAKVFRRLPSPRAGRPARGVRGAPTTSVGPANLRGRQERRARQCQLLLRTAHLLPCPSVVDHAR